MNKYKFLSVLPLKDRIFLSFLSYLLYFFCFLSVFFIYDIFFNKFTIFSFVLLIGSVILFYICSFVYEKKFFSYLCKYKDNLFDDCIEK